MICPRCLFELNIKTQMKIEKGFVRCILCKHKILTGTGDETERERPTTNPIR